MWRFSRWNWIPFLGVASLMALFLTGGLSAQTDLKTDIPWEELSNRDISQDWGKSTLEKIDAGKWKHAETEHFIIHYTKDASRISRRAEEIYKEIFDFFGNPPDRMAEKKSHIYAIHEWEDFLIFRKEIVKIGWIGGICRGNEFWFPSRDERGDFDVKGRILNHEMTHLVFNRMFNHQVPTWLNEGVAEYFGARENMGMGEFRRVMGRGGRIPLETLLGKEKGIASGSPKDIQAFYTEAAILVDFLTTRHPPEKLVELVKASNGKVPPQELLTSQYGYADYAAFEEAYAKYRKRFGED